MAEPARSIGKPDGEECHEDGQYHEVPVPKSFVVFVLHRIPLLYQNSAFLSMIQDRIRMEF